MSIEWESDLPRARPVDHASSYENQFIHHCGRGQVTSSVNQHTSEFSAYTSVERPSLHPTH